MMLKSGLRPAALLLPVDRFTSHVGQLFRFIEDQPKDPSSLLIHTHQERRRVRDKGLEQRLQMERVVSPELSPHVPWKAPNLEEAGKRAGKDCQWLPTLRVLIKELLDGLQLSTERILFDRTTGPLVIAVEVL